jgi:hypothetical protein
MKRVQQLISVWQAVVALKRSGEPLKLKESGCSDAAESVKEIVVSRRVEHQTFMRNW